MGLPDQTNRGASHGPQSCPNSQKFQTQERCLRDVNVSVYVSRGRLYSVHDLRLGHAPVSCTKVEKTRSMAQQKVDNETPGTPERRMMCSMLAVRLCLKPPSLLRA